MALLLSGLAMQLSFAIGFLTKKFDGLLLIGLIVFIFADFLVMRIEYWEFLIFAPLFIRFNKHTHGKIDT